MVDQRKYPDIAAHHVIVDNCAHQLVRAPEQFEVIVTSNMNGDLLSDLTSGLVGGLGFAPGANLGDDVAIFEAVHGSAPKYAGKDVINPSAVLLSGVMMLRHLGELEAAQTIEDALVVTLEEGTYTRDVRPDGSVSTTRFTDRVIANLGRRSSRWGTREHRPLRPRPRPVSVRPSTRKVIGADVFVEATSSPEEIGRALEGLVEGSALQLKMISNRGTRVYPPTGAMTDCVDHFRCRFVLRDEGRPLGDPTLLDLVARVGTRFRWMHVEKLEIMDGEPGFTRAQGED